MDHAVCASQRRRSYHSPGILYGSLWRGCPRLRAPATMARARGSGFGGGARWHLPAGGGPAPRAVKARNCKLARPRSSARRRLYMAYHGSWRTSQRLTRDNPRNHATPPRTIDKPRTCFVIRYSCILSEGVAPRRSAVCYHFFDADAAYGRDAQTVAAPRRGEPEAAQRCGATLRRKHEAAPSDGASRAAGYLEARLFEDDER